MAFSASGVRSRDRMAASMIYARKGEIVTCENGHPVGIFNRDVICEEAPSALVIDWAIKPAPKPGDSVTSCQCGAPYARAAFPSGMQVRIGTEWRAPRSGRTA